MICLDEMGPQSAKSFAGTQLAPVPKPDAPAERARQEIDYGRRGTGYVFGAFRPATGAAFTRPYGGRTIANWVDFLGTGWTSWALGGLPGHWVDFLGTGWTSWALGGLPGPRRGLAARRGWGRLRDPGQPLGAPCGGRAAVFSGGASRASVAH